MDKIRVRSIEQTEEDSEHSATKEEVDKLVQAYRNSPLCYKPADKKNLQGEILNDHVNFSIDSAEVVEADSQNTFAVSWPTQFGVLFQRYGFRYAN